MKKRPLGIKTNFGAASAPANAQAFAQRSLQRNFQDQDSEGLENKSNKDIDGHERISKKEGQSEVWETLPFGNQLYQVSNLGNIKSYYYEKGGRLLNGKSNNGYKCVDIRIEGKRKTYCIHKLVAEMFCERPDEKHKIVIHKDNDRTNNQADNLQWVTTREAHLHQIKNSPKTLQHFVLNNKANAKLEESDVIQIKKMLKKGIKQNKIAYMFCVSSMQITRIKKGENWSDVGTGKRKRKST